MRSLLFPLSLLFLATQSLKADDIHVLIWDERQPRQAEAYDNFLGNEIAKRLGDAKGLGIKSVALDDPEQGLSTKNLEWADVIVWWGHVRQREVTDDNAKRILDRVLAGEVDLVALHSAHWAKPFVEAMNWRSVENARKHFASHAKGKKFSFETVLPPRQYTVPIHGSLKTPAYFGYKKSRNQFHAIIHLPYCCFPDYRPDGKPGALKVRSPKHPIAKGLPMTLKVTSTEMYNEPFHVPDPDEVVFEETWEAGERFRSGMVWNIGKGKVFYFRPGHETYPVYKQPQMIQVIENACRWLGQD
ncbi:MAG: trehalose utilization protein [Planctomycetaceae bacterium]|nr:trehalose utilization protein [Planctomycetaceae bacterium]